MAIMGFTKLLLYRIPYLTGDTGGEEEIRTPDLLTASQAL